MPNLPIIRPEPKAFADYNGQEFQQTVETNPNESQSTKRMTGTQGTLVYYTEKVTYPPEGGILMKYKDVPYLRQGFVFPEALDNVNNLKKLTVFFLALLKGKGIKERIGNGLAHYCWIAEWMFYWYNPNTQKLSTIYLAENRYRQSVRELIKLINNFIDNLGIKVEAPEIGKRDFGRAIGTMLEYDNAYHWRMEDIFTETTKELLIKNPRKELTRLLAIYKQREKQGIDFKAEQVVKLLRFILLIPSVKKAFRKAVQSVDISKMATTNAPAGSDKPSDRYFQMIYSGYDFEGKPLEERLKIWLDMSGGTAPPRAQIPVQ